jgi:hypothetical protein
MGPNGALPWYYTDREVMAKWRITDQQEVDHWSEIVGRLEK